MEQKTVTTTTTVRKKKNPVKWILIGLGILLVAMIAFKMASGNSDAGTKVAVENATNRSITEIVNASGKVYPEVEVKVSSDISGEITDLTVQEGDSVRR